MRIAVLLTGNIRTWEKSNLLDFIDVDVDYFISTTNKKYNYHPFIKNKNNYSDKINNEIISNYSIKTIFKHLNYKKLLISDDDTINNDNFSENMRNIDSCYHQYNRIKKIMGFVEIYENENNFKYDIIVKSRFDLIYYNKLSHLINLKDYIYTSSGNVQPNDIIIISKRDHFFNIINYMVGQFYNQTDKNSHLLPPHGLLLSALNNINIGYNNTINISKEIRL